MTVTEVSVYVSPAEVAFKAACYGLIRFGIHPTPTRINRALGHRRGGGTNSINGRECKWLRVDLQIPAIRGHSKKPCPWNCCTGNNRYPREVPHG
ncbi:hypothetical protein LCGC14_1966000 [marine sediment metagenome]|uniref:Uncharacterized protein n=1 Tax=marine sediment metagenome TaxID=412755 RepID=A0A0F9IA88_9ZZZZ